MIVHVTLNDQLTSHTDAVAVVVVNRYPNQKPGYVGVQTLSQSDCRSNFETAATIIGLEQTLAELKANMPAAVADCIKRVRAGMEHEASIIDWQKKLREEP